MVAALWRSMTTNDVDGLMRVAEEAHPGLPESRQVFSERVQLYPEGCLALVEGDQLCGYAISHPIRRLQPPPLDTLLGEICPDADHYYIHDIAIVTRLRGRGLANDCIEKILVVANRYPKTSLISVYGTQSYWARFGFVPEPVDKAMLEKLRGYGKDATYLARPNWSER